ncbi:hypothetical protein AB0J35_49535 [Nonomuraea angiospora]|uniref:hypothetical protein n=1 Tax=Nonomuraea angiospora TaxID=46172 RepID=UPI00341CE35D
MIVGHAALTAAAAVPALGLAALVKRGIPPTGPATALVILPNLPATGAGTMAAD